MPKKWYNDNMKDTILTGIRSNEEPTIGNYLGALLPMVEMQKQYSSDHQINMFVPDLHSFTTPIDHSNLFDSTLRGLKYFIAAGLNPNDPNTFIYRQSYIPAHSEMTWILDCFTYVGEMSRMIQFKDKSNEHKASVTMGLMNYPVLMAADILLYNAKYVPVGEDQFQHLEITRDIAERFNKKFGQVFTIPADTKEQTSFIKRREGLRIRNLINPEKKMSKSAEEDNSKISMNDDPAKAAKKIMSATTDSIGVINFDWINQPGITSMLQIMSLLSATPQEVINTQWVGKTEYGTFKKALAALVEQFLVDFQSKVSQISDDEVISVLEKSEAKMTEVANQTLLKAQVAVGLRKG